MRRRNLLHVARGSDRHRELAASLQHDQAACIARLQATSPRGVRACIRRVAGCATSTSFASHASTEAGLELTLHLDHPMGSHQDGFEVVAALQKDAGWRDIPVIVITSLDLNAKDRER